MNIKSIISGLLFSLSACADGFLAQSISQDQPWSITASIGQGKYQHFFAKDGSAAIARLALDNELLLAGNVAVGLELGAQNYNRMHIDVPQKTRAVLGWLPVRSTLGPMFDLLVTAKSDPLAGSAFFAQLKGGVAYRRWKSKNEAINNLSQIAGEIQAGFGYPITALASLSVLYQGVYGNDPKLKIDLVNKTGHVSNIPALHAVLLGFSVNI